MREKREEKNGCSLIKFFIQECHKQYKRWVKHVGINFVGTPNSQRQEKRKSSCRL